MTLDAIITRLEAMPSTAGCGCGYCKHTRPVRRRTQAVQRFIEDDARTHSWVGRGRRRPA